MGDYQQIISDQEVAKQLRLNSLQAPAQKPDKVYRTWSRNSDLKKTTESLAASGPRAPLLFQQS
jgi:hypothetical protein